MIDRSMVADTEHLRLEVAATAGPDPSEWVDILGPTFSITVERSGLDVGTLTASIADASLDPAAVATVQPGKQVRLLANVGGGWLPLFTGDLSRATASYAHAKGGSPDDPKAVRIEVTATDLASRVASLREPRGVHTIEALRALLGDAAIPYTINGTSDGGTTPTVVALNDNASLMDQVAIARDSALGYAWVGADGRLWAADRANMPTAPVVTYTDVPPDVPHFYDERPPRVRSYSDIEVGYSTEECINHVTIEFLRYKPVEGVTEPVTYGPYVDEDSVSAWGVRSATYTISALTEDEAEIQSYAASVLAANSTPQVRVRSMRVPVVDADDLNAVAGADLYAPVRVVYADRFDGTVRLEGIRHEIAPESWIVDYTIAGLETAALPSVTPNPPGVPVEVIDDKVEEAIEGLEDTLPPPHSPTPEVTAGIGALFGTWELVEPGPGYRGPITYEVHVSASNVAPAGASTLAGEIQGGFWVARSLPDGSPFVNPPTPYYMAVRAKNSVGAAPVSAWVAGTVIAQVRSTEITDQAISTPKLATNAITTDLLLANDAWIGAFRAVDLTAETITGPRIQTLAAANSGIKLDGWTNTLRAWDALGNQTFEVDGNTGLVTAHNFAGTGSFSAGNATLQDSSLRFAGDGIVSEISRNGATLQVRASISSSTTLGLTASGVDVLGGTFRVQGSGGFAIDTTGGYLRSPATTTITSGAAANVRVNTDPDIATFAIATSSRKGKAAIEPLPAEQIEALLTLDLKTWFDMRTGEGLAEWLETGDETALSTLEPLRRWPGLIAEDVHDAGASLFVDYDKSGEPMALFYDRIGVAWIPLVRDLIARVEALEAS